MLYVVGTGVIEGTGVIVGTGVIEGTFKCYIFFHTVIGPTEQSSTQETYTGIEELNKMYRTWDNYNTSVGYRATPDSWLQDLDCSGKDECKTQGNAMLDIRLFIVLRLKCYIPVDIQ